MKERDCVIEQVVAMKRGPICEVDELIATRDVEMDANQQTVQLQVEDVKPQGDMCVLQQRVEEGCVEETLQGNVEDCK